MKHFAYHEAPLKSISGKHFEIVTSVSEFLFLCHFYILNLFLLLVMKFNVVDHHFEEDAVLKSGFFQDFNSKIVVEDFQTLLGVLVVLL